MIGENAILLAAQLIDARKSMRSLLGDKYETTTEPCRILIRAAMKSKKCNAIKATTDLITALMEGGANGMVGIKMLAACVDVMEAKGEE